MTRKFELAIHLSGRFRMLGADGADLTPRSIKAQGLIALLAAQPDLERTRVWLQDKLWSDRAREQGAASLRQALSEIRRSLGPYGAVLRSDRRLVSLDPSCVTVLRSEEGEFLEGLDVRDQEFEDWLRAERSRGDRRMGDRRPASVADRSIAVVLVPMEGGTEMERLVCDVFTSRVATSLAEQLNIAAVLKSPAEQSNPRALHLSARSVFTKDSFILHAACRTGGRQRQIWGGTRTLRGRGAAPVDDEAMLQMVSEAVAAISIAVADSTIATTLEHSGDPVALTSTAINCIFEFSHASLQRADSLLQHAHDLEPRGVNLAWRAFLRVVGLLERVMPDDVTTRCELDGFLARALELEPMNSQVLALSAYIKLVETGETAEGFDLARRATALNSSNPFAWLALCTSNLYVGRNEDAHICMHRARYIGSLSPYRSWWDAGIVLTATANCRYDEALQAAISAHQLSPQFRPPLRYMIALYLRAGEIERARDLARQLQSLEPDFVPERLVEDHSYPARMLRRSVALEPVQFRDLT